MLLAAYKSPYFDIIIDPAPAPATRYAAEELQRYIDRITLAAPAIQTVASPTAPGHIFVGPSPAASAAFPDATPRVSGAPGTTSALAAESYLVQTRDRQMLILGGSPRGTLYAVYDVLERLGVRWWTATEESVPTRLTLETPPLNFEYHPPLLYRAMWYRHTMQGHFQARLRLDAGAMGGSHLQERHGGMEVFAAGQAGHTYEGLVPTEKYFDKHPEYFSLVNGQRLRYMNQLCCTNPEVADIAAETARQWLKQTPQAKIISVTQNDWGNWCTCPACAAIIEREGATSGPNLHLANEIAKRLGRDYPGVLVNTFAYAWTEVAPKHMTAHPNVLVRIAPIGNCFGHPIRTCSANRRCRDSVQRWSEIARQNFVWHYVTDFFHYLAPFPNLPSFRDDLHFYLEHGLKGLFLQGDGTSLGGDMAELKAYVMAKLAWNPALDDRALRHEFIAGYYRAAGEAVEDYVSTFEKAFAKAKDKAYLLLYRSLWDNDSVYLTEPVLQKAEQALVKAHQAAKDDPEVAARLGQIQANLDYTQLFYHQRPGKRVLGAKSMACPVSAPRRKRIDRMFNVMHRNRVTHYAEDLGRYTTIDSLRRAWQSSIGEHPVVRLKSGGAAKAEVAIVPDLGGRIVNYRFTKGPAAGHGNLLGVSSPKTFGYPCAGGYEEYTRRPHQSPGFTEAFKIVKKSVGEVVLRAELETGLTLERSISLDPANGDVVVSTQLRNHQDARLPGCLRAHLEIDLATPTADVELWLEPPGAWQRQPGPCGGTWFDDDVVDAWAFWSPKLAGGLVQHWSRDQVGALFLGTMPSEPTAIALDLARWRYEQEIPPGGHQQMDHRFGWVSTRPG